MFQDVLAEVLLRELAEVQPQLLDLLAAATEQRLVAAGELLQRVNLAGFERLRFQLALCQFLCLGSQLRQDLFAGLSRTEVNEHVVHG